MARRRLPRPVLVAILAVQSVTAVFAWRDLKRRDESRVRGSKKFWRIVMVLNPGNSLLYWLFGRRRG